MKELDIVTLTRDFAALPKGTVGTIVYEYDGTAFEVEFFDSEGNTIDVLTTPADVIKLVNIIGDDCRSYAESRPVHLEVLL